MALFGLKQKKEDNKPTISTSAEVVSLSAESRSKTKASDIIHSHITEKSNLQSQSGVYTFQVNTNANKHSVARTIASIYKIIPVSVAMINTPIKKIFVRGRPGKISGIKKALVTLKKGDKIDFA